MSLVDKPPLKQTLDLSDNELGKNLKGEGGSALPAEIGHLTSLTELDLTYNTIHTFPREIGALSVLQRINANRASISTVPQEFSLLSSLTELQLESNRIRHIPEGIFPHLTSLRHLYLSSNSLQSVPADIGKATALEHLYLQENQIRTLPQQMAHLTSLLRLWIHANPMRYLPSEMVYLNCVITIPRDCLKEDYPSEDKSTPNITPRRLLHICCAVVKNSTELCKELEDQAKYPRELKEVVATEWRRCYKCRRYTALALIHVF